MPPDEGYWCEYAFHWTDVKTMWQLKMTKAEADAVMEMLSTCPVEVNVLVVNETAQQETGEPEPREEPEPTEELQNSVYGSCKEAKAAGKQRARGSRERRATGAEAWVTRRRWSRPRGTGTEMEWCANGKILRVRA